MAKHDVKGDKLQINRINSKEKAKIVSENHISYDGEKTLDDYDLVYKKYVDTLFSNFMGGANFLGQFATLEELESVPAEDIPEGSFAYVGTGDDFAAYYWDNNAQQWGTDQPSFTNFSADRFYKGNRSNVPSNEVLYTKGKKDIVYEQSGNLIIAPEFMGNFVFTRAPVNLRGVESVLPEGGQEFTIENRTGAPMTVENGFAGPANSSFNIGSTLTIPNGGKAAFKSEDNAWVLGVVNEVGFSDHLDSVNASVSIGSDGLSILSDIYDSRSGEYISFKEINYTPDIIDGIVFIQLKGKFWKRTGKYSAEIFGAVANEEIDNSPALQNYIDTCSRAGQINIEIEKDYYINSLSINSNHSGINIFGKGRLLMLNGPVRRRAIYIYDENDDIENVTIDVNIKGFSRYTLDADGDRPYNQSIGQDHNGIVAIAHPNGRIKNLKVTCNGKSLEGTLVHFSGVENGEAYVTGEHIGTHCFAAEVLNFGANATWPEDFNPNVKFRVDGVNCNTAFDLGTTGSSKSDMGKNIPVAEILGVTLRNQRSNTKVHGFWGVTASGTMDFKNDTRVQGLLELPAFRVYNPQISYCNFSKIRIEGFWRAFEGYSSTGKVEIDNLIIKNCYSAFYSHGNVSISNLEIDDVFIVNEFAVLANVSITNFLLNHVRRQKWVDELNSIQSEGYWADKTIGTYPSRFLNDSGILTVENFIVKDIGEDTGSSFEFYHENYRNSSVITINNLITSTPAPVKVGDLFRINLDSTSWNSSITINNYIEMEDITSNYLVNRTRGVLISNFRDVIPLSKLNGDIFNFTLTRSKNRYEWIDNNGNIKWSETLPTTITGGNFLKATTNQVWDGTNDVLFVTPKTLYDRTVRQNKTDGNTNYNFSSADDRLYVIFTGSTSGNANILAGRFQQYDELVGENQGAPKTVNPDAGITVRAVNNSLIIPTNSKYHIRFNTATEAILTVTPDVTSSVPNASTTQRGIIEQATDEEVKTGTDTERAVDPKGLKDNYISFTERTINSTGTVAIAPLTYNVKEEKVTFTGSGSVTLNGYNAAVTDRTLILINKTGSDMTITSGAGVPVPFAAAFTIPNNQSARFQVSSNLIVKEL